MYAMREIRKYAKMIAERFCPLKIILFGSYAYGSPNEDSDVDILVLMDCPRGTTSKAIQIRCAIDAPFPVDLLVRSPRTFARRIAWGDYFLEEIEDKGRVLYEATNEGMDQKGRGRFHQRPARTP